MLGSMDSELERRYQLIEERAAAAEAQWKRRMDAEHTEWTRRADRADARMDRFDVQLQATKKLVEAGMKIVMRNSADIKALGRRIDDLVRGFQGGNGRGNGNGHRPKNKPS